MRIKELWIEHDEFCKEMEAAKAHFERAMSGLSLLVAILMFALLMHILDVSYDGVLEGLMCTLLALASGAFGFFVNFVLRDNFCDEAFSYFRKRRFNRLMNELEEKRTKMKEKQ